METAEVISTSSVMRMMCIEGSIGTGIAIALVMTGQLPIEVCVVLLIVVSGAFFEARALRDLYRDALEFESLSAKPRPAARPQVRTPQTSGLSKTKISGEAK